MVETTTSAHGHPRKPQGQTAERAPAGGNLAQMPPTPLNGSHLELPSPLFNALFLTVHG